MVTSAISSVSSASPIIATSFEQADCAIARLGDHKTAWTHLGIPERLAYLHRCIDGVRMVADAWAEADCAAKGIDRSSPLAGEAWGIGPAATLINLRQLVKTLEAGGQPKPSQLSQRPDGQQVATVFPDSLMDRLLWLGFTGEVWIQPDQPASQGLIYRQPPTEGGVALVLGAGNVSSISPMDSLYKLFAENQVVLLKMNPVNAYVGTFLAQAFQSLIADGFLEIVYGGAELGAYLCQHPSISSVHVTGSHHTHDAIVWGAPAEQPHRKAAHQPVLTKPITSELGCVTPILVVPGNWSPQDIAFQARHVAGMVTHNASFNCVAGKVVITAKDWQQRDEFLSQLRQALAKTPARKAYYPGAQQRYQAFLDQYPQAEVVGARSDDGVPWTLIPDVPLQTDEYALTTEAFCGVLAEVSLEAADAEEFLQKAVPIVNETIWGNLSCVLLVDGMTQRYYAAELDQAIADLRYGVVGINTWTGAAYLAVPLPWGAFPGNPLENIQSGQGAVHNTYLFDHPQKAVLRAPFRIIPKPIWFADHKTAKQVGQRLTALLGAPSLDKFLSVVLAALWG